MPHIVFALLACFFAITPALAWEPPRHPDDHPAEVVVDRAELSPRICYQYQPPGWSQRDYRYEIVNNTNSYLALRYIGTRYGTPRSQLKKQRGAPIGVAVRAQPYVAVPRSPGGASNDVYVMPPHSTCFGVLPMQDAMAAAESTLGRVVIGVERLNRGNIRGDVDGGGVWISQSSLYRGPSAVAGCKTSVMGLNRPGHHCRNAFDDGDF